MVNLPSLRTTPGMTVNTLFEINDNLQQRAVKHGIGPKHPEMQIAKDLQEDNNRSIRQAGLQRYYQLTSYIDIRVPNYNANDLYAGKIWIGEGPYYSQRYKNTKGFLKDIALNQEVHFQHVLALGPVADNEKVNFINYMQDGISYSHYKLTSTAVNVENPELHCYQLDVRKRKSSKANTLSLTHLPLMEDMKTLDLKPSIVGRLLGLADAVFNHDQVLFIHCSAGLGRSGTLALALILFHKYQELIELSVKKKETTVFNIWNELNRKRPATVVKQQQLGNALQIADAMHELYDQLRDDGHSIQEYLTTLGLFSPEESYSSKRTNPAMMTKSAF